MAWNVSRGLFTHSLLSVIHAERGRGNFHLVSRNIGSFSTSIDVPSYSSNIPGILFTDTYYDPLSLGTPSQQFQHGNASQPSGTLEYPYVEQPQDIHATNHSPHDWQQSTSLPQRELGPHPQSQAWVESGLVDVSLEDTLFGPPPEVATTNLLRDLVDESAPQVTNLPPR